MTADRNKLYTGRNCEIWITSPGVVTKRFLYVRSEVLAEVEIHKTMSNEISEVCTVISTSNEPHQIVMEHCEHGSIEEYIQEMGTEKIPEERLRRWFWTMRETVRKMHALRYVHRAIHASNWLVTADLSVKLSDFGHAKEIMENSSTRSHSEFTEGGSCKGFSHRIFAVDAFLLGKLFLQMVTFNPTIKMTSLSNERIEEYCSGYTTAVADMIKPLIFLRNVEHQSEVAALLMGQLTADDRPVCNFCQHEYRSAELEITALQCGHCVCSFCLENFVGAGSSESSVSLSCEYCRQEVIIMTRGEYNRLKENKTFKLS